MKTFTLITLSLFAVSVTVMAQNSVVDTHPTAAIFAIDYSTGQEAAANSDAAIVFKNSLIDLVTNTTTAKLQLAKVVPGKKSFVITQMDPQTNGNAYQLALQNKFLGQNVTLYTFVYNVDRNQLLFFNTQTGGYNPVVIQPDNINNMNNCVAFGKFNAPQPPPQAVPAVPTQVAEASADAAPIDADVSINIAPPALPDYEQPECPQDDYLWQPGYWAYGRDVSGYYWVPGAWVAPPTVGLLWTPPYWGYEGSLYVFHGGYWGNTIGFYGGVNYGFGYAGVGFVGGNWYQGHFRYNTAILRVNERVIRNVYVDRTVIVVGDRNRVSFNGRGGIIARPNEREMAAMKERHVMATQEQIRNQRMARSDKSQFASANGGKPANFATQRVEPRRDANERPGMNSGGNQRPGNTGTQGTNQAAPGGNRPGMAGTQGTNQAAPGGNRPGMTGTQSVNSAAPASTNTPTPAGAPATNQAPQGGNRQGAPGATPAVPGRTQQGTSQAVPAVPGRTTGTNQTAPGGNRQNTNRPATKTPPAKQTTPPAKQEEKKPPM